MMFRIAPNSCGQLGPNQGRFHVRVRPCVCAICALRVIVTRLTVRNYSFFLVFREIQVGGSGV